MHDVSEGGVKRALMEVAEALDIGLDISSEKMPYERGVEKLNQDMLRVPTYGALIAIIDSQRVEEIVEVCGRAGYPCADIGYVRKGTGLYLDGARITGFERVQMDELYGALRPRDEHLDRLRNALVLTEKNRDIVKLIPQVGINMVYAKPNAGSFQDVAALSGRVIESMGRPRVCGEVIYGGSLFTASVALAASSVRPEIRSAVNVRGGDEIVRALEEMGLKVSQLPASHELDVCPTATYIKETRELFDAYAHPGSFGIESSTTLIGESPEKLVEILVELARHV